MPLVALLEVIFAGLSRLIASRLGQWLISAVLFFGINFVSKKVVVDNFIPSIASHLNGMGSLAVQWMAYLNIDRGITIVLSGIAAGAGTKLVMQRVAKTA